MYNAHVYVLSVIVWFNFNLINDRANFDIKLHENMIVMPGNKI